MGRYPARGIANSVSSVLPLPTRTDEWVLGDDFDGRSHILGSHRPAADCHATFPDFKKQGTDLLDQLSYGTFLCKIPFAVEEVSAWGNTHQ
jgi:hypothetical protein